MFRIILISILLISANGNSDENIFYTKTGLISFRSDAPQELIRASSSHLIGLLDTKNRTFVFQVSVRTFEGFNNKLQQEHFNEKYLESDKFPEAIFTGKIIEDLDLSMDGTYDIRAKGKFNIHGKEAEKIIRGNVLVKNGVIKIDSRCNIILSDYNIKIPKVVHEKIANEVIINLKAELNRKDQIEK